MKAFLLLAMAVVLGGCASSGGSEAEVSRFTILNSSNLFNLEIGMTKDEVKKAMSNGFTKSRFPTYYSERPNEVIGLPRKREAYEASDGGTLEFWFYYTQIDRNRHGISDKNFTPLCFTDGKLKGWGRNFYDDTIKIRKEVIKKDN